MITSGLMSSNRDDWETPLSLFNDLQHKFGFVLDACATPENAKCAKFFTPEDNGLAQSWLPGPVFMNPPYGREIGKWVYKAWSESSRGCTVVCLLPARTDTAWWHDYIIRGGAEVRFLRGRLKFSNSKNSAPFPSAIVIFAKETA